MSGAGGIARAFPAEHAFGQQERRDVCAPSRHIASRILTIAAAVLWTINAPAIL